MSGNNVLQPTAISERISPLDTTRGIALLGISLMNIVGFGLYEAYTDPANSGGATGWNLNAWWINSMFFEGTMRGMFSMLFGAGIILFTARSTQNANNISVTDAFFRRLTWLLLFGVIHAYLLLWDGEILYAYALTGMLAFSFRNLRPKKLIIWAVFLCFIAATLSVKDYFRIKNISETAASASTKVNNGLAITKKESQAIKDWEGEVATKKMTSEGLTEKIAAMNGGYFSIVMHKAPLNEYMETTFLYRHFWDVLAMMLIGMAFLKNGILKAAKSKRFYLVMGVIGYGVGLTTNYFELNHIMTHDFSIISFYLTDITYDLGRVSTTVGHISLIMLFIKSGTLKFLQTALAAVGQMALTNYIMQTIICNTIFLGPGFGMFGKLQRYELYYIVFGIWVFQLIISPIWLSNFRFGPLEWIWRSLTYWEKQPFRKTKSTAPLIPGSVIPGIEQKVSV